MYADAAAATPLSRRSRRELLRLLPLYGNPGALHGEAVAAKKELERARNAIAAAIGAHTDEIIFTASGTEANNLALAGFLRPLLQQEGSAHAITLVIEHQSVLEPLRALQQDGLELTEVGVQPDGVVFANAVADALQHNTKLVSVQLVNSEVGAIEPVREIVKTLRRGGRQVVVHCDASQAPLWLPIKVEHLGVDMMTLDAQKVLGPKGVGALYVKRGTPLMPVLFGGKQEAGLRGGTENVPLAGAFAAALADALAGAERRAKKVAAVRDYLWQEIITILPDAVLHGPPSGPARVANSLNISIPGLDANMAVVAMDALGVAVSTRSACNAGDTEPSHVIAALGVDKKLAKTAIRITLLPDISRRQARRIAAALAEVAGRYKQP